MLGQNAQKVGLETLQWFLRLEWRQYFLRLFYATNWVIFIGSGLLLGFATQLLLKILITMSHFHGAHYNSAVIIALSILNGLFVAFTSIYASVMTNRNQATTYLYFTAFLNVPAILAISFLIRFTSFFTATKRYLELFHADLAWEFECLSILQQVLAVLMVLGIWVHQHLYQGNKIQMLFQN